MATDPPRTTPESPENGSAGNGRRPSQRSDAESVRKSQRAGTAKKVTPATNADPAPVRAGRGVERVAVLRERQPPRDQLDFDDRHDTRATETDDMASRYQQLRAERRKDDRHKVALGLVILVVATAVYVAGYVVLSLAVPALRPLEVAQALALPYAGLLAGLGVRSGVRGLGRYVSARQARRSPPP